MFENATGHSTRTWIELRFQGKVYPVGQIASGVALLRDEPEIEIKGVGNLIIKIDDDVEDRPVLLSPIDGKQIQYAQTDSEKEEILAALPANRNPVVLRFKGLGEMNSSQLRDTTLDPSVRVLLRVDIERG